MTDEPTSRKGLIVKPQGIGEGVRPAKRTSAHWTLICCIGLATILIVSTLLLADFAPDSLVSGIMNQLAVRAAAAEASNMNVAALPTQYTVKIVKTFPHDSRAFTQGLAFHDGHLYEGTGLNGQSEIRRVELTTGRILTSQPLENRFFGEGITILKNKLYQLTWITRTGFVYDLETFKPIQQFTYPTAGWGLTNDGLSLIMSDGSSRLYCLNPKTFERERTLDVRDGDSPIGDLNELEFVDGEILANIWREDRIARISPMTGAVSAWIDCSTLLSADERKSVDVLNGIAWDAKEKKLYLTGKLWPKIFQVTLVPQTNSVTPASRQN